MTRTSRQISITLFLQANSHGRAILTFFSLALLIPMDKKIHMNVKNTSVFYIYGKWLLSCGPKAFPWISKAVELVDSVSKGSTKITLNSSPG